MDHSIELHFSPRERQNRAWVLSRERRLERGNDFRRISKHMGRTNSGSLGRVENSVLSKISPRVTG